MVGNPLRPAKSAEELLQGIKVPEDLELTLADFPLRQDSTNVKHQDRAQMAEMIAAVYDRYDGFIILHGTDSLAETCAYLAMCFKRSLQKPLMVIGAQMTKDESGSDVQMQIENTLRVIQAFIRNQVVGVYNVVMGEVLDGARVRKRKDSDFAAFYTPGKHPVAYAWPHIMIKGARKRDPVIFMEGLRLQTEFEPSVVSIMVSADTPPYVLTDMIRMGRVKGIILECKGAGNIPNRPWQEDNEQISWIDAIKLATEAGVHVGILSPFDDGRVILDRYELGSLAKAAGAISLESLTPAMADIKFRQGIALHSTVLQQFISTNMVGELLEGFEDMG